MHDPFSTLLMHDIWLVGLAAVICVLSGHMAPRILDRAASASNSVSWFWIGASGVVVGSTVWSVHFIAVLALKVPGGQLHDHWWTFGSLFVSMFGMTVLAASMRLNHGVKPCLFKALSFCAAVSSMHYSGMKGVHGAHQMAHDTTIVGGSLVLAFFPALLFVRLAERVQTGAVKLARTFGFVATVLIIHFGGMMAMVHMGMNKDFAGNFMDSDSFVLTVTLVTSLVFLFGTSIVYLEKRNFEMFEQRSQEGQYTNHATGTANRAGIVREIEDLIAREQPFTLIGLSLVGFREARDLVGRAYLRQWVPDAARRIETASRPGGHVGYAGSGFFYILLSTQANGMSDDGVNLLRDMLGDFEMRVDEKSIKFEKALGVVHYPADAFRAEDLVDYCDFAVDCALEAGTSTLARFEKDRLDERTKRHRLAVDIREALREGQLELHYQPQGRLLDGETPPQISGFEALARWTHPKYGRIPPDVFVPLCETGGLNKELANWALITACAEFSTWPTQHSVAVNIPPELLNGPELIQMVRTALAQSGLAPQRLEIEVTESGIIADTDAARLCIDALHDLGVRVSLDDFGTGNASLQTLFQIPLDKIKLDRMFLPRDQEQTRSIAILEATAFIAGRLGADVLAEGVETEHQIRLLQRIGYDSIQGYYISPALPAKEARRRFLHAEGSTTAAE